MNSWNALSAELLRVLGEVSLRAVLLAAMAGLLALFVRRNSAAQHAMWALVVVGMLALPLLRSVVPAAYVYRVRRSEPAATVAPNQSVTAPSQPVPVASPSERPAPAWPNYVGLMYLAGVAIFGAQLAWGLWMTRRLWRGARSIALDLGAPALESDRVRVPITAGFMFPRVLFPHEWRTWPAEKTRLVLAHEMAHARRRDPLLGLLAALNRCLFWFHPLAWWLERRLAVLAEHAADDAALAVSADTQSYARILLEIASGIAGQRTRVIWNAIDGQLISRRIRRIVSLRSAPSARLGLLTRIALLSCAAALVWISLAVDLQRVAQAQSPEPEPGFSLGFHSGGPAPDTTTAEEARQLERQLAADPEDETTRRKLLRYYWQNKIEDRRIPLILWLIDHHPESPIHAYLSASILPDERHAERFIAFGVARSRWLAQVEMHPNDVRVLFNAARAVGEASLADQIDLLEKAQKLDPADVSAPLFHLYALVLEFTCDRSGQRGPFHDPALAAQVRSTIQASSDASLVGDVARWFVNDATMRVLEHADRWDIAGLRTTGTELVTHAQALDPQNREWSDLMEGVRGMNTASPAPPEVAFVAPRVLHIGAGVAAERLLDSPPPVYPPLAKLAHISGAVKLKVHIAPDGSVKDVTVISGHPLLIPAALAAVKKYVYKPVTWQGQAVDAIATVEIGFSLGSE